VKFVRLDRPAKFQQRRRVRRPRSIEVDSDEARIRLAAAEGVLDASPARTKHCWATYLRGMRAGTTGGPADDGEF
jgi:hypothetical protein